MSQSNIVDFLKYRRRRLLKLALDSITFTYEDTHQSANNQVYKYYPKYVWYRKEKNNDQEN